MIRLCCAELRKVWGSRFFLLSLVVLLCANLFLLWLGTSRAQGSAPYSAYHRIEESIAGMSMDEMGEFLHGELARVEGIVHVDGVLRSEAYSGGRRDEGLRERYADDFAAYEELYRAGGYLTYAPTLAREYAFLKSIVYEYDTVAGYEGFLDSIDEKAQQLSGISIFANSGYDTENIAVTAEAFEGMRGTPITYYPQKGLMTALDFALTDVVAVFAMVLIATVLVRAERDNGLLALIRSTPGGRLKTAGAKLIALAVSLFAVLALLYGVNFAYCGALYGIGPLGRTIQSVPQLMRSTWKLTVGEYIGCFFLTKWAAALICGAWVMLAMLLSRRMLTGSVGALALIGANLAIRAVIPATSRWNVIKYANLVSLLRTNELIGAYRNLYWFGHPVPLLLVECIAATVFAVGFLMAFLAVFSRHVFRAARPRAGIRIRRRTSRFTTLPRQETYKLLVMQGAGLILVLFALVQGYTAVTTESYLDVDEIYYRYYMQHVEGPLTRKSIDWLTEQNEEFEPIYKLQSAMNAGRISTQEGQAALSAYAALQQKMGVFQRVVSMAQNLNEKPRSQMVYETGWLKLFDTADRQDVTDTLAVALVCALCFSGLFAMERQTGMVHVIAPTPLGRAATVRCKLRLAGAVCAVITAVSLLPRFWIVIRDYGLGAWFAPVYSISEYASAPEIPMFLMAALLILSRYLAVLCMALATLALSQRIGNAFGALFASLVVFALSPALALAGLEKAKWCGMYLLVHVCALVAQRGGTILAIVLPTLCGAVCWCCDAYLMDCFGTEKQQ